MRIISLNGRPQCGKTHTLFALCDMLAKTTATLNEETIDKDKRMTFAMDGVIISVCTGGDNMDIIQGNIAYFERHHCTIATTANRSKAAPKWTLEGYAHDNGHTLNEIVMPYANFLKPAAWSQVQHLVAEHIYEMVMKYVGEENVKG